MKTLLQEVGLEGDRVEMYNIGASDAVKFAAACKEITERAKILGPNPVRRREKARVE